MERKYEEAAKRLMELEPERYQVVTKRREERKQERKQNLIGLIVGAAVMCSLAYGGVVAWDKEADMRAERNQEYIERIENRDLSLSELQEIMSQYDDGQDELETRTR